jgi:hypothetical protein
MQNHLCKTLAHFVLFIGSKLGLSIHSTAEQTLLDGADSQWKKEASFVWAPLWNGPQRNYYTRVAFHGRREEGGFLWNMRASAKSHVLKSSDIEIDTTQGWTHPSIHSSSPNFDC